MEKKEAMKILKDFYDKSALFSVRTALDTIIPELKESEDERIRTALLNHLKKMWGNANDDVCGVHVEDVIAWLESLRPQKQWKSAEWSEEDEQLIDEVVVCLRKYAEKVQGGYSKSYVQSLADRIESLRPGNTCKATGWSEEDEAMFQGVIETEQYMLDVVYGRKIFAVGNEDLKEECTKELAWLKSLRPQKQWKSDWSEKDEKLLKLSLENLTNE